MSTRDAIPTRRSHAVTIYTDGACSGNPGPGGWAWAVPGGAWASGVDAHTTNQRMEVTAALEALRVTPGAVDIVSDSTYVVNCFKDNWWKGWLRRGWKNSTGKAVANRDLWEPLIEIVNNRSEGVVFHWVKGHSGDEWNDVVDQLAVAACQSGRGASGQSPSSSGV